MKSNEKKASTKVVVNLSYLTKLYTNQSLTPQRTHPNSGKYDKCMMRLQTQLRNIDP